MKLKCPCDLERLRLISPKLTYLFNVEKDKEYEIGLQPISEDYDNKIEEVKLKLDTAKYEKSLKT